MAISVIIIEDDVSYNKSLQKIIESDDDLHCVCQCYNGEDALMKLAQLKVDVALVDIKLQDMTGIDILKIIRKQNIATQYIICTSYEDEETIFNALKAGASGYLLKGENMHKIIESIKEVYSGGAPMSSLIARKVLRHFSTNEVDKSNTCNLLTKAEKEIIMLLAEGLLYKEIAFKKNISTETVKKHLSNTYKKLHVNNKVEAINALFKH